MDDLPAPAGLDDDERFVERLAPLLWAVSAHLHEHVGEATAAVGLSVPAAMALRALDPDRPRPMSGLAGALGCDPSNVTGIADQLEAQGLVTRQPAVHDRRVKELMVTPKGVELRTRFVRELARVPLRIDLLRPCERTMLIDVLERLVLNGKAGACAMSDPSEPVATVIEKPGNP